MFILNQQSYNSHYTRKAIVTGGHRQAHLGRLSFFLYVFLFVGLTFCLLVSLYVCWAAFLSAICYRSVFLSVCLSVCCLPSVCLSVGVLFCISVCLLVWFSVDYSDHKLIKRYAYNNRLTHSTYLLDSL